MARYDDDYRFRSYSSREDRGSHRDSLSGSRAGWRSHDDHDDRGRSYGSEREDQGSSRWFGSGSHENEGRYGGYEGERGDAYRGGYSGSGRYGDYGERGGERGSRYGSEYGYGGGSSYGRGNYEHDDMSSGIAGGGRGYGYGPGNGGDMYQGRGGALGGGISDEMGGSHSQGMGRQDMNRQRMGSSDAGGQGGSGGWYGRRSDGISSMSGGSYGSSHGGGAGRYGSEHAGMGGGYGIGSSGQEHHGGKGPKGYTRSDDRIKEDVCDCLTDDPMLDAGEIEVQVKNGEVTLSGNVSDRLAKRHAEDMIERVSGVKNVQNSIKVKEHDTGKSSSGTQSGKHSSMSS
jgi:hypothetical protein